LKKLNNKYLYESVYTCYEIYKLKNLCKKEGEKYMIDYKYSKGLGFLFFCLAFTLTMCGAVSAAPTNTTHDNLQLTTANPTTTANTMPPIISVHPYLNGSNPVNNATNVPINQVITLNFTTDITPGVTYDYNNITLTNTNTSKLVSINTNIDHYNELNPDPKSIYKYITVWGYTLTISPNENYVLGDKYTLNIPANALQVTGITGTNIFEGTNSEITSSFTVTPPPTVKTTNPINGAVISIANPVVKFTFSEPVKAGNLWFEFKNSSGTAVPFTFSPITTGTTTLTLTPTTALPNGLYTVILHTGSVTDMAGNPIAYFQSKFTVNAPLTVKTTNPINGAVISIANPVVKFTFSEPVKAGNLWFEFKNSSGTAVPFTFSPITTGTTTLTLTPTTALPNGLYTVILHTGSVTDMAGNPIAYFQSKFTVKT
jgi:methionine-rich copper-binding protein CopC